MCHLQLKLHLTKVTLVFRHDSTNRLTRKLEAQVRPTFYRQCLPIAAGRSKVGLGSQWSLRTRCTVSLLVRPHNDCTTSGRRRSA